MLDGSRLHAANVFRILCIKDEAEQRKMVVILRCGVRVEGLSLKDVVELARGVQGDARLYAPGPNELDSEPLLRIQNFIRPNSNVVHADRDH